MEFEMLPIRGEAKERLAIAGFDREVEIYYDGPSDINENAREATLNCIQNAYSYILSILGEEGVLGMKNVIKFKRNGRHAAMGIDLHINASDIEEALNEPSDGKKLPLQQSLIIHEVLHHTVEQEHFPIFLEMIYMLENGQSWRIDNIKSLYLGNRLSQPYLLGLKKISEWLGFDDIEKMLQALHTFENKELKEIFKIRYEEYCQEDETLAVQVAKIRQRINLAA